MPGGTNILVRQSRADGLGKYPFSDASSLVSSQGAAMPREMFIDAILYPAGGSERQFLSKLTVSSGTLSVTVSDATNELCSGSLLLDGSSEQLLLYDAYERPAGLLLGGSELADLAGAFSAGTYDFSIETASFVATCVVPQPQLAVDGLLTLKGKLLSGDVWLVGGDGVVLEAVNAENTIRINVVGDPLFKRRQCEEEGQIYIPPTALSELRLHLVDQGDLVPIKLVPDDYGNVVIHTGSNQASDNVLRILPVQYGIQIKALSNTSLEVV